jgi:acyl-CoA reductase-like NAD-dependent aldehyde dehydrogenase
VAETTTASAARVAANGHPAAGGLIEVYNPATGERIATVPRRTPEEVTDLVARARAAQPGWEALGFEGRARVLRRAQRWVVANAERVIRTIVSETGKTWEDAQTAEVAYAAHALGFWAKSAPRYLGDERVRARSPLLPGRRLLVRYAPVGVVGVIGPWNFPLLNSFGDCIPALAAGNSVVLKPSQVTPLTSLLMHEMLLQSGLPQDAFIVATGDGHTGGAMIDHVDYVMFTGSTETGKKIMERAAQTLTPVSMELGGKDPMIVCADADLERAANAAVYTAMHNAGQACTSTERVYVEQEVYDDFVARVTEKARGLRQGVPGGPGSTEIGAMIYPPQADTVAAHVEDATERGAGVLVGGQRGDGPGSFFEPTVLVRVDHGMACMTEETFGPTLPVMKVHDLEEAVRLANDSPFGLQASVWTRDVAKGERLARQIEAGVVCVNDAQMNYGAMELPMGGWKESGLGSRHGADGIRKYTRRQSLMITRFAPKREIYMFPYAPWRTRLIGRFLRAYYGRRRRR